MCNTSEITLRWERANNTRRQDDIHSARSPSTMSTSAIGPVPLQRDEADIWNLEKKTP